MKINFLILSNFSYVEGFNFINFCQEKKNRYYSKESKFSINIDNSPKETNKKDIKINLELKKSKSNKESYLLKKNKY